MYQGILASFDLSVDTWWSYFVLSQFPIDLSPQLLQPPAQRVLGRTPDTYAPMQGPKT
jgi:hypothetical protein